MSLGQTCFPSLRGRIPERLSRSPDHPSRSKRTPCMGISGRLSIRSDWRPPWLYPDNLAVQPFSFVDWWADKAADPGYPNSPPLKEYPAALIADAPPVVV